MTTEHQTESGGAAGAAAPRLALVLLIARELPIALPYLVAESPISWSELRAVAMGCCP